MTRKLMLLLALAAMLSACAIGGTARCLDNHNRLSQCLGFN